MRQSPNKFLEALRDTSWEFHAAGRPVNCVGTNSGCFQVLYNGTILRMVSSHGDLWEHVSVSVKNRTPNWPEMCYVKNLFWEPEETVIQIHPPESAWVNNHPFCLHLWRPVKETIPMPPSIYVGVKEEGVLRDREHARFVRDKYMRE